MNWDALGASAELIGAAAVVATLAYFSIQLRQSQRSSQDSASLASMDLNSGWRKSILENGELAVVLAKANDGESLSAKERIQLHILADEIFLAIAVSWTYSLRTGAFHEEKGEVKYLMSIIEPNPGLIKEWKRCRSEIDLVAPDFGIAVDEKIEEMENPDA